MKKNFTFNDFSLLMLKGTQTFKSYGEFIYQCPNSTKSLRKKMIFYHYKNKN